MNSVNRLKVAIAFLAGLVVALGGALLYTKSSPPSTTLTAVPVAAAPAAAPTLAPAAAVEAKPEYKPVSKTVLEPKRHKIERATPKKETAPPSPVQVAQNAPAAPIPIPAFQRTPEPQPMAVPPPPPPVQPRTVTLQPGTNLSVRLDQRLSTEHNYEGDTFRGTLQAPIVRNGFVIADRGSQVMGRIVTSEKAGRVKGLSELALELTSVNTTDGQQVRIQTNTTEVKGQTSKKRDTAEVVGGSALGAIIGAIAGGGKGAAIGAGAGGAAGAGGVLITRGKPAVIEAETQLTFQLSTPVTITEHLNR